MDVDGKKLRELRLRRILTLRALSVLANVSYPNISRLEQGHQRATQSTIIKLADALGVDPADLLKEHNDVN